MLGNRRPELLRPPESDSGFSLIEMLIAIVVLTVGLVSIVGLLSYVSRANADSNITSVLATTVQAQMDQLKSATWTVNSCDPALQVGGSLTSNAAGYYTTINGTPAGNLVIRWQVAQGGTADYRFLTLNVSQATYSRDFPNGMTVSTILLRQ